MKHPWFSCIKSWDSLLAKEVTPPFIPKLENALDLRYFDPSFTQMNFKNEDINQNSMSSPA